VVLVGLLVVPIRLGPLIVVAVAISIAIFRLHVVSFLFIRLFDGHLAGRSLAGIAFCLGASLGVFGPHSYEVAQLL
jgi:hypothetical protein